MEVASPILLQAETPWSPRAAFRITIRCQKKNPRWSSSSTRWLFKKRHEGIGRSPRALKGGRGRVLQLRVSAAKEGNEIRQNGGDDGGEDLKRGGDRRPVFKLRWRDLLDPDPENILAVALTGLLAWASVQVLWQLFFISLAILLAALKYSFIAALLLFILITLL